MRAYELRRRPKPVLILETLGGETLARLIRFRSAAAGDRGCRAIWACSSAPRSATCTAAASHLDVKPSNVIVEGGRARVIDLSLARRPGRVPRGLDRRITWRPSRREAAAPGRPPMCGGSAPRCYEAATGSRPFPEATHGTYPQAERRAPSVAGSRRAPAELTRLIDACLAPEPADRPAVGELADGLDAVIGD